MLALLAGPALVLALYADDADAAFIARVESSQLLDSNGGPIARIERDADGHITMLMLTDMQLDESDFAAIGKIETLEHLVLHNCPVTDADMRRLGNLSQLKSLNLTGTEITDATVDEIPSFPALRSLCLGNVFVTSEAVDRLKARFEADDRPLSLGYSRRR